MPEIDGIELVQWVATRKSSARVIVTTGYSPEYATLAEVLGEGRGLALVTTLIKPIKPERLRSALKNLEHPTDAVARDIRAGDNDWPGSADCCDDINTDH